MDDQAIEQEIIAKGKTAPRVTPADIEANIAETHFFTAGAALDAVRLQWLMADHDDPLERQAARDVASRLGTMSEYAGRRDIDIAMGRDGNLWSQSLGLLTFCVLVLRNGFTVTGESACASPENFDAEIGRSIARDNAVQKIWPLMGYALKQQLHTA